MFSYTNQQLLFDNNYLFGQEDESGPNPPNIFPSSYDHDGYNDLLLAIQLLPTNAGASPVPTPPSGPPGNKITDLTPCTAGSRKRTLRRDRHSKIVTANGPRDRRMRLSLDVAKKFFELQDILGYDKASKTVEWLLTKSKGAIKSLTACRSKSQHRRSSSGNAKMESSTSECEVDSVGPGKNDKALVMDGEEEDAVEATGEAHATPRIRRASTTRTPRKATTGPLLTKEWRAKARARARERTIEKRLWSSRFENGSLPKQLTAEEIEHPSQWGRTAAIVEGGEQSLPMMMGHEYGGITTSDYSYNHNNVLHNADPFNSLQEYWNLHPAAAGVNIGEQRGTIDAHFQTRGWNI